MKYFKKVDDVVALSDWNEEINSGFPNIAIQTFDAFNFGAFMPSEIEMKNYYNELEIIKNELVKNYKCPDMLIAKFIFSGNMFIMDHNHETGKSFLKLNYLEFFHHTLDYFVSNHETFDLEGINEFNNNEKSELLGDELRAERFKLTNELNDIKKNKISNPINSEAYIEMSLKEIIIGQKIASITDMLISKKHILKLFEETVVSPSKENFNYNTFKFCLNSFMLEACISTKNFVPQIYQIINYYQNQIDNGNLSELRYNIFNKDGEVQSSYNFTNFASDLQKYILEHKNVSMERLGSNFFKGYSISEIEEYLHLMSNDTLSNFEELDSNSHFFINQSPRNKSDLNGTNVSCSKDTNSLLSLQKRQFYADNKSKIFKYYLGKKKFKGHLAIILQNGYVIFEKYDNIENNTFTKNGAAYIMNINNFLDLSSKSLSEVRQYVKLQNTVDNDWDRVSYRCHTKNWQTYLQGFIDAKTNVNLAETELHSKAR